MIFIKVIKNVFDNLRYDLRDTKYEVERIEKRKKRKDFVDLFNLNLRIVHESLLYLIVTLIICKQLLWKKKL